MSRITALQTRAALLVLRCFAVLLSAQYVAGDRGTLDNNVRLSLKALFGHLPEHYPVTHLRDDQIGNGLLFVGNATVGGLRWLEPDRPMQVFQKDNRTRIIANLRSSFLEVNTTWKLFSGDGGTFSTYSRLVGYELVLDVSQTAEGVSLLNLVSLTPVLLERLYVNLYGAGSVVSMLFNIAGYLLQGPLRLYWSDIVTAYVERAFEDVLSQLQ